MLRNRFVFGFGATLGSLCLLATVLQIYGGAEQRLRIDLDSILIQARPCLGRLAGFPYAPYDPNLIQALARRNGRLMRGLEGELPFLSINRNLSGSYVAKIIAGDLNRVISRLEAIASDTPDDGLVYSDLSALYLERAIRAKDDFSFLQSLNAAERACAQARPSPEAHFNRAMALTFLRLGESAQHAWADYIERTDSDSPWKREAEANQRAGPFLGSENKSWDSNRDKLVAASRRDDISSIYTIAARFPQASRLFAEEQLLPGLIMPQRTLHLPGTTDALNLARHIGESLHQLNGEGMIRDSVAAVTRALRTGNNDHYYSLLRGHETYGSALGSYNKREPAKALPRFADAERLLALGHSPFAHWARFYQSLCWYYAPNYAVALSLLEETRSKLGVEYPALRARIAWVMGLIYYEQGKPSQALPLLQESSSIFSDLHEAENLATVNNLLATCLDFLGLRRESWSYRMKALRSLSKVSNIQRVHNILGQAAESAVKWNLPLVGLDIQNELVGLIARQDDPLLISIALWQKARVLQALGRLDGAERLALKAVRWAAKIPDKGQRSAVEIDAAAIAGSVLVGSKPSEAEKYLTATIDYYKTTEYRGRLAQIFQLRSRALSAQGRDDEARKDLRAAVIEIGAEREGANLERRSSFMRLRRDIFYDLVESELRSGNVARALADLDRSRTWSGRLHEDRPAASSSPKLARAEGITFVEYLSLPDRLLIFIRRDDRTRLQSVMLTQYGLERLATELRRSLYAGAEEKKFAAVAGTLFDLLIRPLDLAGNERRLVIIPGIELAGIPFAVLRDARTGRYLIESYSIAYSFNIEEYRHRLSRDRLPPNPRALLVLGATSGTKSFSSGQFIRDAGKEIDLLANVYGRHVVLKDDESTPSNFEANLPHFDVVHFAGHARFDPKDPIRSWILFPAGSSALLTAGEIASWTGGLNRVKVIFLSACGTSEVYSSDRSGSFGVAGALWLKGAGSVVGSFFDVEDSVANRIAVAFHRKLLSGLGAAEALQSVQKDLLLDGKGEVRQPRSWGAFGVYGQG